MEEEINKQIRGGSRTAATSKMELFVIIVNGRLSSFWFSEILNLISWDKLNICIQYAYI